MLAVGLIERTDEGWHITGFLNYQRSRAEMDKAREVASGRARKAAQSRWGVHEGAQAHA
jgi:hypothetical protein